MSYQINPAATPYFSYVGNGKTPVFILDNFMQDQAQALLQDIESLQFDDAPTYYPGIRAKLPDDYIKSVAVAVVPLLQKIYQIPENYQIEFFDSYYSLVTYTPDELSNEQRIPHFDGTDPYRFALIHYLNHNPHGGTALYRHTPTNLERITESNVDQYLQTVTDYIEQHGGLEAKYIDSTNTQFEKIGEIPFVQNRFAIYPGNLLHSGTINPITDIDSNPVTGRLTANIFLNFVSAD